LVTHDVAPVDDQGPARRSRLGPLRRLDVLDRIALALLLAGLLCLPTGLLPVADAHATMHRILPLLLFLGTVIVLAELAAAAEVFDVVASRMAIAAGGSTWGLFLCCVALASLTTITLNLDTTAVLLTPVMLVLARKISVRAVPMAVTTVWLANTASLLLPVSNLTNLLAADRVALSPLAFAQRLWLPQVVAIAVTMLFAWLFYWRHNDRRYRPPDVHVPGDPLLCGVAAMACLAFIVGIVAEVQLGLASTLSAGLLTLAFAVRNRRALRPALVPWRLLVFVTGLFLVVQTFGAHGLDTVVSGLIGNHGGPVGALRTAATGAALSNIVNNLPAYVAGEAVVPIVDSERLLALLIGTNVGPIVTPWASLATLLWYERCVAHGVDIGLRRFMLTSAGLAVTGLVATATTLLATG
jgi:arsenical pump membrane protein